MNCPICNSEIKKHTAYAGLVACPNQILTGIPHYEMVTYKGASQNTIKHSLYIPPMNLVWWGNDDVVKIRLIGDFRVLAREKANNLEEVMRIGNRYRNLSAFL